MFNKELQFIEKTKTKFGDSRNSLYICGIKHDKCRENMARPIKETPILTGEDAERFVKEMERVDAIPAEVRAAYEEKLEREFQEISKRITICI